MNESSKRHSKLLSLIFTLNRHELAIKTVKLRRIPFKVRAITCKNYLLKIYSQHGNFLNAI